MRDQKRKIKNFRIRDFEVTDGRSDVYFNVLRGLSFSFPLFVGMMFCLAILAVGLDNDLFLLVYAEEKQEQLVHFMSSSLDDSGSHDLYHESAFKELENLIKNFEYTFDLEGNQIFPTKI